MTIVAVGGGFSYGQLGMSHFATEDLAIMRALPNMTVVAPTDPWEGMTGQASVTEGNCISDFPSDQFAIRLFCDACGHQADLDRSRVPEGLTVPELTKRLRCSACGSRECSIRIIFAGAGGFSHS